MPGTITTIIITIILVKLIAIVHSCYFDLKFTEKNDVLSYCYQALYSVYRSNNNVSFPSITDAFNETKDKVKYLESLHKYFDQLLHVGNNSLVNICSNTLPGLMASVRQMDSISRFYARNGYLGLLFSKVIKISSFFWTSINIVLW